MGIRQVLAAFGAAVLVAAVPRASAGPIVAIGPFTGLESEGFEAATSWGFLSSLDVFGGHATFSGTANGSALSVAAGWSYGTNTLPHGGGLFLGTMMEVQLVFDEPVTRFGGWLTSNVPADYAVDAEARFYDATGGLIAAVALDVPLGSQWAWNGWEADGAPIKRVVFPGRLKYPGGPVQGYIQFDDLQLAAAPNAVPEPATWTLLGVAALALVARRRRPRGPAGA